MAKGRHPILTVLVILGGVALLLGASMYLILHIFDTPLRLTFGDKIGVIPIQGTIVDSRRIVSDLVRFRKDNSIKAIILRVNSPGGDVGHSQEIYREVCRAAKEKTVIGSMGGVAASGGYYIVAGADRIVANPGTITGSIGVLMEFIHFKELLDKIGIGMEVLKSGEYKDLGQPHKKLSDKDKALLKGVIKDIQEQFVSAIVEGRSLAPEDVRKISDGRIFSGARAKELGLVDRLGNFRDAVHLAKELSRIKGEPELVYPRKRASGLWDYLSNSLARYVETILRTSAARVSYRWDGIHSP